YQWYGAPHPDLPEDRFATVATGSFDVSPGDYVLDVTSDDGVRVWLDGKLVHDDWTYHPPRQTDIRLSLGGAHSIRVEHFEIDGFATLMVQLRRASD
ncbi:MAG: hypothetical protein HKN13_01510, partial [Rhodothermales bacterium]|nr:hypothetical protein [Rhodothermales bacterium]